MPATVLLDAAGEPRSRCLILIVFLRQEDGLLWLYVRGSHHFHPLLGIAYKQSFKFGQRALERGTTELTQSRIEGGVGKARINL